MLDDVAEVRPLFQPLDEPARVALAARVFAEAGQEFEQPRARAAT
jgi:hypothetical protein